MSWFNYNPASSDQTRLKVGRKWWGPNVTSRRVALMLSYAPDWIFSFVIGGLFFLLGDRSGYKREFSLTDKSLQYTYAVHERITFTECAIIAIVAPLVIMPLTNLITIRSFWDLHNSWLGLICSCAFAGTTTNIVKITVGRPRPDTIDRCQPRPGSVDRLPYGLSTVEICTQANESILMDGWKSFFSGHSSLAFAGLGFLSFYLAGKLHLFDKQGHAGKAWIALTPLIGAALVAISRTMDNRHHWQDVLVGSAVGLAFAYFSYRQYYPPLNHRRCHQPYRPRIDWDDLNPDPDAIIFETRKSENRTHGNKGSSSLPTHNGDNKSTVTGAPGGSESPQASGSKDLHDQSDAKQAATNDLERGSGPAAAVQGAGEEGGLGLTLRALEVDRTYPDPKRQATV